MALIFGPVVVGRNIFYKGDKVRGKFYSGLVIAACVLGSLAAQLQAKGQSASDWILIAQTNDDERSYSGRKGSYELFATKGGTPIAMILGQTEDGISKKVTYNKWYVAVSDCEAGMGKLVALKVSGEYEFETDYVAKGKNIASGIGDLICDIYLDNKKAMENKGV